MARYPREEITYKKLYKNLNLDKPLDIEWPEIEEYTEIVPAYESNSSIESTIDQPRAADANDLEFCKQTGMDPTTFLAQYTELDTALDKLICSRLDSLKPLPTGNSCDVCGDTGEEEENTLLACSGCGITIHQVCYGVVEIPSNFWFCNRCVFSDWASPCSYCEDTNGIFKRLDDGRWAHAVCASIHPRLSFANTVYKDPVDTSYYKKREGTCSICTTDSTSLIKCSYLECKSLYHASCAAENIYCDLNNRLVYCPKHDPRMSGSLCSRRKIFQLRTGYEELENEVFIRCNTPLQKQAYTDYRKAVETEPSSIPCNMNVQLYEYWKKKRTVYRTAFSDPFKFSNYVCGYRD